MTCKPPTSLTFSSSCIKTFSYSFFKSDTDSLKSFIELSSVGAFSAAVAILSSSSKTESCLSPQFLTSSSDKRESFFSIASSSLQGKRLVEELEIFFFKFEPPFEEKPTLAFEFLCLGIGGLCSLSGLTNKGIKISFNLSLAI